jgi:hypothetical protein
MSQEKSHPTGAARGVRFFQLGYGIAFRYKFISDFVRYKFVPYKLPLGKANWLVLIPYIVQNATDYFVIEGFVPDEASYLAQLRCIATDG